MGRRRVSGMFPSRESAPLRGCFFNFLRHWYSWRWRTHKENQRRDETLLALLDWQIVASAPVSRRSSRWGQSDCPKSATSRRSSPCRASVLTVKLNQAQLINRDVALFVRPSVFLYRLGAFACTLSYGEAKRSLSVLFL